MAEPAAFNITLPTPEGLTEIIHMGREISNLQGIYGALKLSKTLRLEAGVISFGPGAKMAWDDNLLFYVLAALHGYLSVYLPVTHLDSPYVSLFEVTKKDEKDSPAAITETQCLLFKKAFWWNSRVSSEWLNIAHKLYP